MRDREFMSSNQVLSRMIKTQNREGKDTSQHKEQITEANKDKLQNYGIFPEHNPKTLQKKVHFVIMCPVGRRSREGLHCLKRIFAVLTDSNGFKYVKITFNKCYKNHHGLKNTFPS